MKKSFTILAALMVSAAAFAQGLNFSGSWKLNGEKSKLNAEFSFAPKEIIITQSGNDMSVEKHSSFQDQDFVTTDKLTLDGKECLNTGFQDTQKKSTCTWSEDKASLKIISKMSIGDGDMTITEVYKMDGSNMVLESSASSSYGDLNETIVYDKK
ncbi:MAG TPA: hypothetical protein DEO60_11010 [Bacteroidales bacterium]|jgi:hypothetical protein|nr:hypothetical protein [Bacteroidales bacterium]